MYKQLKNNFEHETFNRLSLGKYILNNAIQDLKQNGFDNIRKILKNLKEASCLGNHEASFILSVIYLHGISIKADSLMSSFYLMRAVLDKDRMSLLALGHKHRYALDNLPEDYDHSYCKKQKNQIFNIIGLKCLTFLKDFYAQIADIARDEMYNPISGENYPNHVRLNRKEEVDHLATEDNDMFAWLKDQAKKGVTSAQVRIDFPRHKHANKNEKNLFLIANAWYYVILGQRRS